MVQVGRASHQMHGACLGKVQACKPQVRLPSVSPFSQKQPASQSEAFQKCLPLPSQVFHEACCVLLLLPASQSSKPLNELILRDMVTPGVKLAWHGMVLGAGEREAEAKVESLSMCKGVGALAAPCKVRAQVQHSAGLKPVTRPAGRSPNFQGIIFKEFQGIRNKDWNNPIRIGMSKNRSFLKRERRGGENAFSLPERECRGSASSSSPGVKAKCKNGMVVEQFLRSQPWDSSQRQET